MGDHNALADEVFLNIAIDSKLTAKIFLYIFSFRTAIDTHNQKKTFNQILSASESIKNPAIVENLFIESGLQPQTSYSLMSSSKSKFPQDEYAKDLRQLQASKLAFR